MKAKLHPSSVRQSDPWKNVQYPCLIEQEDNSLAIATSRTEGFVIYDGEFGEPDTELADLRSGVWKDNGWTPVVGPRTITFEN